MENAAHCWNVLVSKKAVFLGIIASLLLSGCAGSMRDYGGALSTMDLSDSSIIYPDARFDPEQAKRIKETGKSTINGLVCYASSVQYIGKDIPRDVRVSLYPVTPYLEAWYKLRNKSGKKQVAMVSEAISMRYDVRTDHQGKFSFTELRPGKYFIQIEWYFDRSFLRDVYTGSSNGTYGNTINHYRTEQVNRTHGGLMESFIEIKNDGDTESITMSNKEWNLGCGSWF